MKQDVKRKEIVYAGRQEINIRYWERTQRNMKREWDNRYGKTESDISNNELFSTDL